MQHFSGGLNNRKDRRKFLKNGIIAAGAATMGAGLLAGGLPALAQEDEKSGRLTRGDAAILRFLAAAEILETDLWQQYNELGGRHCQVDEVFDRTAPRDCDWDACEHNP